MSGRRSALVVGVNQCGTNVRMPSLKYAEEDAKAVYEVLTDRGIGTFDTVEVELLTGDRATSARVKSAMRRMVMAAEPADLLLVYFAGHAYVPPWGQASDAYLVTADLDLEALGDDPESGLRMAFLKRDVFDVFAGTSFLILDCCHAGVYADIDTLAGHGSQVDRHSALLSCSNRGFSRESDELRHGILTHHLLRAMRGAAEDSTGRVTFARMAAYIVEQDLDPAPGQVTRMWGPTTVLTQPTANRYQRKQPLTEPVTLTACATPLEARAATVDQLLRRFFPPGPRIPRQVPAERFMVEAVRAALDARAVAVVQFTAETMTIVDRTPGFEAEDLRPLLAQGRACCFPIDTMALGHIASDDLGHRVLLVPVLHDESRALFLAVVDAPPTLLELGEALAAVVRTVWRMNALNDPLQAEVRILTDLRDTFGRLPRGLYERCYEAYQTLLGTLVMVFQPVISLDRRPQGVGVHSYEALARRTLGDARAPATILQIPHTWGERFIILRDTVLLGKAVADYVAADAEGAWEGTKPISINVAVRSLLSDGYAAALQETIRAADLDASRITLEISEHDPIAPGPGEEWPEEPLKYFHNRLSRLARDLEVNFAVDDFGVGYSSVARMAELPLTQIKVDRAILHHPLALDELDLVMKVARHGLGAAPAARAVILEGFDDESPITLKQVYERRIRYVQGFISGEPASNVLHPLSQAVRDRIATSVRGEDDRSDAATSGRGRR